MQIVSIILARGGSKGIPKKNIKPFCGKPLITWTINQLKKCCPNPISSIWVSSDSAEILNLAIDLGVCTIRRPSNISGDEATSESGWIHAIDYIESQFGKISLVVAPQVTSPVRDPMDFTNAINEFHTNGLDSMFSATYAVGLYMWSRLDDGSLVCDGYDYTNPHRRRQDMHGVRYIENGSFYLFTPEAIRSSGTRFGNKIGVFEMPRYKSFEIDDPNDFEFCEMMAKGYLPDQFLRK